MKRRQWLILAVLVLAMLALTGCGVSTEGVDVTVVEPNGPWETFVVWPLAHILIWLNGVLLSWGIPYHWGWAIILFTLLVKLITFPLNLTQIRGMQAQKEIQPRLQELQKKFGKDRERLAAEQMKLYKEAGVNPLSGCLPLLVQMPILFGLYAALVAIGPFLVNASFFWIPNLAFPQYEVGLSWIPAAWEAGDYQTLVAYLILPILLVVSQYIMQKWMTPAPTGDASQGALTQNLGLIMTLFFGYFTLQVPAGLTLYWVTSNLLQMLQQWVVTRFFGHSSSPALAGATAGGAGVAPVTIDGTVEKVEKVENTPAKPAKPAKPAHSTAVAKPAKGKTKGK